MLLGFIITINQRHAILAGATEMQFDSPLQTEIDVVSFAMDQCLSNNWKLDRITCDSLGVIQAVRNFKECVAKRCNIEI